MEKIYIVVPSEVEEDEAVSFSSRADAEEYVLSVAEEPAHECFLNCVNWDDFCERRDFEGFVMETKRYTLSYWGKSFETINGMILFAPYPYIKEIVKL